jgi:hypothetical protein
MGFVWLSLLLLLSCQWAPSQGWAGGDGKERPDVAAPEPPREFVDTAIVPSSGRKLTVRAGEDLQDALDLARPGDVIELEAGAQFKGPFALPNKKQGQGWITIQSSGMDRQFPEPGRRVRPSDAKRMARLVSSKGEVLSAERGAHHYRLMGLEIQPQEGTYLNGLVWFGTGRERSVDEMPHHIIIDRCFIHGDPQKGSRRGVVLNGRHLAVIDSHVSDFKDANADSQALVGWSGSGPFKIVNNYLEGAAENINFGGADPLIPGLVPSDIEIRRNHLSKPLSWKRGEPGYDGSRWMVKNLLELKNARRVLIDGNVLEHSWADAQSGFAVLFTVRNQDGRAPWSAIEDVQFTNNIVRHAGSGITLMGHDNNRPWDQSVETKRILIKNNLWHDIGGERWGGKGILFQLVEGTSDVAIEQNTGMQTGFLIYSEGPPHRRFVFRGNIAPHNEYGIFGRGVGSGERAIQAFFHDAVVRNNAIAGADAAKYPKDNVFPKSVDELPFEDVKHGNYRMKMRPRARAAAPLPADIGADMTAVCAALGPLSVEESVCQPDGGNAEGAP